MLLLRSYQTYKYNRPKIQFQSSFFHDSVYTLHNEKAAEEQRIGSFFISGFENLIEKLIESVDLFWRHK